MTLALVDSGGANIGSVRYALRRLGVEAPLTSDAETIRAADRVILPGVGAAAAAMDVLRRNGLDAVIPSLTQPVLGICLGMQLLFEFSEEGNTKCLGVLSGSAKRMPVSAKLRIPHMGWNRLEPMAPHRLVHGLAEEAHAYFVHSYSLPVSDTTVASAKHGEAFAAIAADKNFMAAQFHPERSAETGQTVLRNFLRL